MTPDHDLVHAYQSIFGNTTDAVLPYTIRVIGDLGAFCGATVSPAIDPARVSGETSPLPPVHSATGLDPMAVGVRIGRREVFDRICAMLNLDQSEAWRMIERARQMRRAANG